MNPGIINSLEYVMELFDNTVGFATSASFSPDPFDPFMIHPSSLNFRCTILLLIYRFSGGIYANKRMNLQRSLCLSK